MASWIHEPMEEHEDGDRPVKRALITLALVLLAVCGMAAFGDLSPPARAVEVNLDTAPDLGQPLVETLAIVAAVGVNVERATLQSEYMTFQAEIRSTNSGANVSGTPIAPVDGKSLHDFEGTVHAHHRVKDRSGGH